MVVAVLSDSHDRLDHLEAVLQSVRDSGAAQLCFLGDFCAPFALACLAEGYDGPIDAVFGNNDGDVFLLGQVASKFPHVRFHHPLAELEIDGARIALQHYPELGKRLAQSGAYDAVFTGHDHQRYVETIGDTLWANPGEIMGRFGVVSYGLYDTVERSFRHVEVSVH